MSASTGEELVVVGNSVKANNVSLPIFLDVTHFAINAGEFDRTTAAECLDLSRPTVTRAVKIMAQHSLVECIGLNPRKSQGRPNEILRATEGLVDLAEGYNDHNTSAVANITQIPAGRISQDALQVFATARGIELKQPETGYEALVRETRLHPATIRHLGIASLAAANGILPHRLYRSSES